MRCAASTHRCSLLVLHPLVTAVHGFGADAGDTVVERLGRLGAPLGPSCTGTVDLGGHVVELRDAFTDPENRPTVLRAPMLVTEISRRRAADAAADAAARSARAARRESCLAQRDRLIDQLERLTARADEIEQQLRAPENHVGDEEIERLLAAARVGDRPRPGAIVGALIDEWDAILAERKAREFGPTVEKAQANLDAVRARIAQKQDASAPERELLAPEGIARVQELHAAVERLAQSLDERRRSERKAAARELVAAVDAERDALTTLGFESYAAFLLALAEGRVEEDARHDDAALSTAEAALSRARDREAVLTSLGERELDLRARVTRMLGRFPGPDVGAELRAGHEATVVAPSSPRDRLAAALRRAGVEVAEDEDSDPIPAAEAWLAETGDRSGERAALERDLAEIDLEGSRVDEELESAEQELAAAEHDLIAGVGGSLAGREAPIVLASVEPGELVEALVELTGATTVPLVIGECFRELDANGASAALTALVTLSRHRQVIVVSDAPVVRDWVLDLGLGGALWSAAELDRALEGEEAERAASIPVPVEPLTGFGTELDQHVDEGVRPTLRDASSSPLPATDGVEAVLAPRADDLGDADVGADAAPDHGEHAGSAPHPAEEPILAELVDVDDAPRSAAAAARAAEAEPAPARRARGAKKPKPAKTGSQAAKAPWEGRFDTTRARPVPGTSKRSASPVPEGEAPLALCAQHRGVVTRRRCARCGEPACDECLVVIRRKRPPVCIECAILESGVRSRRISGG